MAYYQSQTYPWHGCYYDVAWGVPVALVVPPTAENQWHYGWGVGADRVTPIQHQFRRAYPGGPEGWLRLKCFCPTPRWPSQHRPVRRLLYSRSVVGGRAGTEGSGGKAFCTALPRPTPSVPKTGIVGIGSSLPA